MTKTLQAVVSIDTTGSMYAAADEVRQKAKELATRLFAACPGAEIGMIFHGDYCDKRNSYVLKKLGLTSDLKTFINFVQSVGATEGGDAEECYELVLSEAQTMGWKDDAKKIVILMGDDEPHGVNYPLNTDRLNWKDEARALGANDIQVIAVQCLGRSHATYFYEDLATLTKGIHLELNQFRYVEQIVLGSLLHSGSKTALEDFEKHLQKQNQYPHEVEKAFATLRGKAIAKPRARKDRLIPVEPSRFQVFNVSVAKKWQSRDFIESKGITFAKGKVFYPHVTRSETIQHHKEVVLEDLNTGDMFTGIEARRLVGLGSETQNLRANPLPGYRCWIQSTSTNRILRDDQVLYDLK